LLNRAARYFPIVKELQHHLGPGARVLEIGSGFLGMAGFWPYPYVGCDVTFAFEPRDPMLPVVCSGERLPFRDASFDAVVASDVMEHVAPDRRSAIVEEALRVARTVAVFGYPCGPQAFAIDQALHRDYERRRIPPPAWLEEHMLHPFPDENLFSELPAGWRKKVINNETVGFHYWMMKKEMFRLWSYSFRLVLCLAPQIVERLLSNVNHEPCYRKIFILTRQGRAANA
jgi:SAM-dependent methyltransferase